MTTPPFRLATLYWTDPFSAPRGGIDSFLQAMLRLAPDGVNIDVIGVTVDPKARPPGRWTEGALGGRAFRFLPLLAVREPRGRIGLPLSLRYTLALHARRHELACDLVLSHAVEPLLALGSGQRAALVMHTDPQEMLAGATSSRWRRLPLLYRVLENATLPGLERIYSVRESARAYYAARFPALAGKVACTPTGMDSDTFALPAPSGRAQGRAALRRSLGLAADAVIGVCVARLENEKAPQLLVEALAHTARAVHLVLIGEGSLRPLLERAISARGLSGRMFLLGARAPAEVAAVHHGADFYVLPSRYEGMSIAMLEAQACGLPVIAADLGEASRTIEHGATGLIVPQRTPAAFGAAMSAFGGQRFAPAACAAKVAPYAASRVMHALHRDLLALAGTRSNLVHATARRA